MPRRHPLWYLARRTRELRCEKGWTQAQLAHKAKVSTSTVTRFEREVMADPDFKTVYSIAQALGTEVSYLFGGDR